VDNNWARLATPDGVEHTGAMSLIGFETLIYLPRLDIQPHSGLCFFAAFYPEFHPGLLTFNTFGVGVLHQNPRFNM